MAEEVRQLVREGESLLVLRVGPVDERETRAGPREQAGAEGAVPTDRGEGDLVLP